MLYLVKVGGRLISNLKVCPVYPINKLNRENQSKVRDNCNRKTNVDKESSFDEILKKKVKEIDRRC